MQQKANSWSPSCSARARQEHTQRRPCGGPLNAGCAWQIQRDWAPLRAIANVEGLLGRIGDQSIAPGELHVNLSKYHIPVNVDPELWRFRACCVKGIPAVALVRDQCDADGRSTSYRDNLLQPVAIRDYTIGG